MKGVWMLSSLMKGVWKLKLGFALNKAMANGGVGIKRGIQAWKSRRLERESEKWHKKKSQPITAQSWLTWRQHIFLEHFWAAVFCFTMSQTTDWRKKKSYWCILASSESGDGWKLMWFKYLYEADVDGLASEEGEWYDVWYPERGSLLCLWIKTVVRLHIRHVSICVCLLEEFEFLLGFDFFFVKARCWGSISGS